MTDTTPQPGDVDAPFRTLRQPLSPLAVRPEFRNELRVRLHAALNPLPDPPTAQERTVSKDDTTQSAPPLAKALETPLAPYISVPRASEAIDWYRDVLGAIETLRFTDEDGRVGHAELAIAGSTLMLADEYPDHGANGPQHYGGSPVMLYLTVADVDYTYERAVAAGAQTQRPPSDQGHGNRNATIVDPFGHRWMLSQPLSTERTAAARQQASEVGEESEWAMSGRAPVEPGYLTIHTSEPARARVFYGELFGWKVEHPNPDGGGHVDNTRFPLGLAPLPEDRAVASVYYRVDDPDHYAARVSELGGQVLSRNDYDSGLSITCTDDQGLRFDLWRPAPGY